MMFQSIIMIVNKTFLILLLAVTSLQFTIEMHSEK